MKKKLLDLFSRFYFILIMFFLYAPILVMIVLRRNKYERKKRPGCLGWLFGLLGINLLVDFFKKH